MKFIKIFLIVFIFVLSNSVDAADCPVLKRNINKNTVMTNDEKIILNNLFKQENIATSSNIYKSIGEFQKKYKLEVVGTVGPKTKTKINDLITKNCLANNVSVSTSTIIATTTSNTVITKDIDPKQLDLLGPNGGESVIQGMGRGFDIVWTSQNISKDEDVTIELLGENLDIVVKQWKVKNTGRLVLNHNDVDALQIGWFNMRIKHYCNSDKIPCAMDTSENPFVIYPPDGWVAGLFELKDFKSGKKYYVNPSQSVPVTWYSYAKDFDYYKLYIGNVVLGKEVLVENTRSIASSVSDINVKELKKGMTKTEQEIQNAYYVKLQLAKRNYDGSDRVLKEVVSGQFGIR